MGERTQKEEEDENIGLGDENTTFSVEYVSKNFKVEKGLFPFKGGLRSFLGTPFELSSGRISSKGYLKSGLTTSAYFTKFL